MSRGSISKKENSYFNGLWCQHARAWGKALGNRKRRRSIKQSLKKETNGN